MAKLGSVAIKMYEQPHRPASAGGIIPPPPAPPSDGEPELFTFGDVLKDRFYKLDQLSDIQVAIRTGIDIRRLDQILNSNDPKLTREEGDAFTKLFGMSPGYFLHLERSMKERAVFRPMPPGQPPAPV